MGRSSRYQVHGVRLCFGALIAGLLALSVAMATAAGARASVSATSTCEEQKDLTITDDAHRTFSPLYYCDTKAASLLYANPDRTLDGPEPPLDDSGFIKGPRTQLVVVCQKKGRANPSQTGTTTKNSHWLYTKGDEARDNGGFYSQGWGFLPANMVTQAATDDAEVPGVPTCSDSPPPVLLKVPPPPPPSPGGCTDCDADGFPSSVDCNDRLAAINPGAKDIPGNALDEDCSDGPAPFPRLDSTIGYAFGLSGNRTVFTELTVRPARAGSIVRVSCTGPGCPFKVKTSRVRKDARRLNLSGLVRRARLRPGARLEVRVTKAATIGTVRRFAVRAGKRPTAAIQCLTPGAKRPTRCGL
jgi:hypothetical protein